MFGINANRIAGAFSFARSLSFSKKGKGSTDAKIGELSSLLAAAPKLNVFEGFIFGLVHRRSFSSVRDEAQTELTKLKETRDKANTVAQERLPPPNQSESPEASAPPKPVADEPQHPVPSAPPQSIANEQRRKAEAKPKPSAPPKSVAKAQKGTMANRRAVEYGIKVGKGKLTLEEALDKIRGDSTLFPEGSHDREIAEQVVKKAAFEKVDTDEKAAFEKADAEIRQIGTELQSGTLTRSEARERIKSLFPEGSPDRERALAMVNSTGKTRKAAVRQNVQKIATLYAQSNQLKGEKKFSARFKAMTLIRKAFEATRGENVVYLARKLYKAGSLPKGVIQELLMSSRIKEDPVAKEGLEAILAEIKEPLPPENISLEGLADPARKLLSQLKDADTPGKVRAAKEKIREALGKNSELPGLNRGRFAIYLHSAGYIDDLDLQNVYYRLTENSGIEDAAAVNVLLPYMKSRGLYAYNDSNTALAGDLAGATHFSDDDRFKLLTPAQAAQMLKTPNEPNLKTKMIKHFKTSRPQAQLEEFKQEMRTRHVKFSESEFNESPSVSGDVSITKEEEPFKLEGQNPPFDHITIDQQDQGYVENNEHAFINLQDVTPHQAGHYVITKFKASLSSGLEQRDRVIEHFIKSGNTNDLLIFLTILRQNKVPNRDRSLISDETVAVYARRGGISEDNIARLLATGPS